MTINEIDKDTLISLGLNPSSEIHFIHVVIDEVQTRIDEIVNTFLDTSWVSEMKPWKRDSYLACANKTIDKLTQMIADKAEDQISEDIGEYLISDTAQEILTRIFHHLKVPLAEIIKERISGNQGFDFHTESPANILVFGEAKYSGNHTPRANAINQICGFIEQKKDIAELKTLEDFVSEQALKNAIQNIKGFSAAFSLNSRLETIIRNTLSSETFKDLLVYPELYLIAIEI